MALNLKALDAFISMQNSDNTRETYRRGVENFVNWLTNVVGHDFTRYDWDHITFLDVVGWKTAMEKSGLAPASQSTYWDAANSFFNYLLTRELIRKHPFRGAKKPQRIKDQRRPVPPDSSIVGIVAAAGEGVEDETLRMRNIAMVGLMSNGLRIQEIADLNADQLVLLNGYITNSSDPLVETYGVNVTGKGNKQRTIPLNFNVAYLPLAQYLASRRLWPYAKSITPPGIPMFATADGNRVTVRTLQRVFERALHHMNMAGQGYSPHSMRHNYATRMLRAGVSLPMVSKLLGHSDVKTTMLYLHLSVDDAVEAASMDPLS